MKIKIIAYQNTKDLELNSNKELKKIIADDASIIDIKFGLDNDNFAYVMIMYEESQED